MASGIGEQLRAARRAQGIELEAVEERLRIRGRFLRAMEEEQWELLPGSAYARAFLLTYAEYLGLDAEAIVEQYQGSRRSEEAEPAAEPVPQIAIGEPREPTRPRRAADAGRGRWLPIAAIAIVAILGIVLVLGLTGGSDEDGGGRESSAGSGPGKGSPDGSKPASPAKPPSSVVLRLTATGSVWVCLVDQDGRALVEGVTLPAGEEEGPFRGEAFDVTFGNGQVEMEANDETVPIPPAANPVGYRVTPEGARELDEASRPTCT
jgi:cytoskeleton protein RodZ